MSSQLGKGCRCNFPAPSVSRPQAASRPQAISTRVISHRRPGVAFPSLRRSSLTCRSAAESTALGDSAPTASPEKLCELAREFIDTGSAYFSPPKEEMFSDEFVFRGPVVGPLNKKDYLATLGAFKVYKWFPDLKANSFGYSIDPVEPNRVWLFVRQSGKNTGDITLGPLTLPATGREAKLGPEAYSILFDDDLKVKLLTVGYPCDFDAPNTNMNKFGAVFGLLRAVGINQPPSGPALGPVQAFSHILLKSGLLPDSDAFPRSYSSPEDVPQWYKDYTPLRMGPEDVPGY